MSDLLPELNVEVTFREKLTVIQHRPNTTEGRTKQTKQGKRKAASGKNAAVLQSYKVI